MAAKKATRKRVPKAATGPHAQFQKDILTFVEALRSNKRGSVTRCAFGAPMLAAQIDTLESVPDDDSTDDEFLVFPESVRSIASSFDGAALEWTWRSETGGVLTGAFQIPSLSQAAKERSHGIYEGGVGSWPLDLRTRYAHVAMVEDEGSGFTVLIDREGDYAKSEELEVSEVLTALADHLALPGWELSLYAHGFEEGQEEAFEECRANAIAIRTALKLPIPERLVT